MDLALHVDLGEELWERPVEYTRGERDRAAHSRGEEMCHVTLPYLHLHEHLFTTKQLRWWMCVYEICLVSWLFLLPQNVPDVVMRLPMYTLKRRNEYQIELVVRLGYNWLCWNGL